MDSDDENAEVLHDDDVVECIELDGSQQHDEEDDASSVYNEPPTPEDPSVMTASPTPVPDHAALVYRGHTGQVFALSSGVDGLVASGGEDDRALVWSLCDGHTVFECAGHKDSVTAVQFNSKRTLLATGDMAGGIRVWRVADGMMVTQLQASDLEWLRWHPAADVLLAGTADGDLWMWLIVAPQQQQLAPDCKVMPGEGHSCAVGEFLGDGKRALVGYADGTVKVWDLKTSTATRCDQAHRQAVTCAALRAGVPLAATGSEDGTVLLTQTDTYKSVGRLDCGVGAQEHEVGGVESVLFCASMPLLATGTLTGHLQLWDLNTGTVRLTCPHPSGIVKVIESTRGAQVLTACLDGVLRLWDARNGELVGQWSGHEEEILDVSVLSVSDNNMVILSAGADSTCRVFHVAMS